jgi:hypothetical protein
MNVPIRDLGEHQPCVYRVIRAAQLTWLAIARTFVSGIDAIVIALNKMSENRNSTIKSSLLSTIESKLSPILRLYCYRFCE